MHGHAILNEEAATKIFDGVGERSLERLFPGFTEDSSQEITLSAGQSGVVARGQLMLLAQSTLGALVARPRTRDTIRDATIFGNNLLWCAWRT